MTFHSSLTYLVYPVCAIFPVLQISTLSHLLPSSPPVYRHQLTCRISLTHSIYRIYHVATARSHSTINEPTSGRSHKLNQVPISFPSPPPLLVFRADNSGQMQFYYELDLDVNISKRYDSLIRVQVSGLIFIQKMDICSPRP